MDGLPSEFSKEVFLWSCDKFSDDQMAYKAEAFARKIGNLTPAIRAFIDMRQMVTLRDGGILLNEGQEADLLRFCQARMANFEMGGNVKTAMPEYNPNK